MERKVGFIVDSTFKIEKEIIEKYDISVVSLKILIGDNEYLDQDTDNETILVAKEKGLRVLTSQPSSEYFSEAMKYQLSKGYENVVCLTISQKLSGTFNSAVLASKDFSGKVHVFDTESAGPGSAFVLEKALVEAENGKDIKDVTASIKNSKDKGALLFTVDSLKTLVDNGRLSKVAGFIGNILKIKPILKFERGNLDVSHKARSFTNVVKYFVTEIEKLLIKYSVFVRIVYVDKKTQAEELCETLKNLKGKININIVGEISSVVGTHIGPGGLGVYIAHE